MASSKEFVVKHGLAIGTPSNIVFNSSGVLQASALSSATISVTGIDIDGATDIGADLVDADLLLVDDGAGGTNRKTALSRIKKYVYSAVSGDATVSETGALTIASGAVENAMLTNSSITVTDGSNSTATALGGTITFAGTANETTVSESSGTVTIGLPDNVTLASNLNVGQNVVISGNLTVSGTQTVIDTNTVNIGDNIITLNSDETGTPSQNAGIEVERGTGTNVVLRWNETTDKWQFTNDGSSYEDIGAGITVQEEGSALSTAATTLNFVGSAVTATGSGATKTITITDGNNVSNGSNDRILTSTGGNGIQAESDFQFDGTNLFIPNEIRHIGDPDTKIGFGTDTITLTAGGVAIQTMTTSKVGLPDSKEIALGTSDDLTLMHDGTHSEIRNRTGQLYIRANEIFLRNNDNNATYLTGTNGGSTELYYSNNKKLETTSGGVTVTGTVTATSFSGSGASLTGINADLVNDTTPQLGGDLASNGNNINIADSDLIQIGTGNDLQIYHQSDVSYFKSTNASAPIRFQAPGGEVMANFIPNGAVELYHDGSKKLETTSTGTTVTGTLTATTLAGTLSTAAQANITSLGTLTALTVTGATNLGTVQAETLAIENPASHHTFVSTVASKTSAHPYTGQGSSSAYFLDGKESPSIVLSSNQTYRFDQSDNSNSGHPIAFYLDAAKTTSYTTGVTTNGTAGSSGAYTQIVVTDATPPCLYYQCVNHGYMGSVAGVLSKGTTDHLTEGGTNLYYTDARVDAHLNSGSASSGQILSWNGSDYAWVADQTGGGGSSLTVQDEGSALSTAATTLNFVGAGVTASGTGATKTITISGGGGGSSLSVKDEGSALSTAATTLNFVGAGVTASGTGAEKTITIAGGGSGITVQDEGSSLSTVGTTLNFVGSGVTASGTGATKTITISGGGGGSSGTTSLGGAFEVGTGNGSTTTFTSPLNTNIANNLIVSVDGIMQRPTTDYTVSGTTVTFGTAPPSGTAVMVRSFQGAMSSKADFTVQNFTANGSNTVYKLAEAVTSGDHVLVSINGIIQKNGTDYTYNTGTSNVTFDAAPTSGDIISFRTFDLQQSTSATVSDTAPSNPRNGDFWFDSSTAKLYMRYEDGSSNQWVSLSVAGADGADGTDGAPTVYANTSVLPTSGNSVGDFAFATLTKSLHVWDGSEWDRINSGGDENPRLTTTPASSISLNGDGTNTAITIAASDPEGFPITYSYDTNPANPNQITNVVENNGVFTLVPSTNSAHAGNFTLRLKASDGVHITSHAIAMSLSFQTNFTFDTSVSTINSTYTDTNKVNVTVAASSTATSQQNGIMGKGYMEFKIIQDATYLFIGVGSGTYNATYSGSGSMMIYYDGVLYPGGISTGLGASDVDDIIMVAYDTTAEKVWFGMNGTWGTNMNPATDAGITCGGDPSTNGFRPIFNGGSSSASTFRVEIISHTQGAQYTIPTGWALA